MADKKITRVRILRDVLGEKKNDDGELETLTRGSVVDVSTGFAAELEGSKSAEIVEEKTKLHVAEQQHVPATAPASDATPALADEIAELKKQLAELKKK